ncbi:MAG: SDR family oxidoreductase [Gemmatimonadota bacterium]
MTSRTPPPAAPSPRGTVLLTGATGYIGGRLGPRLLDAGWHLRCLTRSAGKLRAREWATRTGVEIVEADAEDVDAVAGALRGTDAAFYLIHSMMASGKDYRARDQALATAFARAAAHAGLPHLIYLGGLGEMGDHLSEHLRSRREVEEALRSTGVPVTCLRAAMIIGSGSASFEILRYLVERLPIMITPRWVGTECQPIAVRNVLHDLTVVLDTPAAHGRDIDIGGPDVVTYRALMDVMAEELGLPRRRVIPVPVLTPTLSSWWIHLVTPLSHRIGRPLAEGLRNRVVTGNDDALELFPQRMLTAREAIRAALGRIRDHTIATRWADAGPVPGDPDWSGGTVLQDVREMTVDASCTAVYRAFLGIGGTRGYFTADWLWALRGLLDRLTGGPGLRRGRRHPDDAQFGDTIDFWRVTRVEPDRALELRAEMRLPGKATLTFEAESMGPGRTRLIQTARFKPHGLRGLLYWWAVFPLHGIVFRGMMRGVAQRAREIARD